MDLLGLCESGVAHFLGFFDTNIIFYEFVSCGYLW